MTGIVVANRPELVYEPYVGTPVRARDWYAAAALANWIRGRGATIVPMTRIGATIAAGSTVNFNFYTKNRGSCIERVWIISAHALTDDESSIVNIKEDGESTTTRYSFADQFSSPTQTVLYTRQLTLRSTSRAELRLVIECDADSTSSVVIDGIACYEMDRSILDDDTTEGGVELYSCSTKQPIYEDSYRSANAVERVMLSAGDARRVGMFHWTSGDGSRLSTNSATAQTVFRLGAPMLARKIGTSDTTNANIYWSAKCLVEGGGTGRITLTHTNSAGTFTDTVDFTNSTSTWLSPRNITNFDCENLSAADGRRGSSWDLVNFTLRVVTTGEFVVTRLESISIWEE